MIELHGVTSEVIAKLKENFIIEDGDEKSG